MSGAGMVKRITLLLVLPFWMVLVPVLTAIIEGALAMPRAWAEWRDAWDEAGRSA